MEIVEIVEIPFVYLKDALEILGFGGIERKESDICDITHKPKKKNKAEKGA
ncbi:MAG: hypothetical protein ACM3TS_00135 [Clostridia bacterium]